MDFLSFFPTIDVFILFLFAAMLVLNFIFIKRENLFLSVLSVYAAFVLVIALPVFSETVQEWLLQHGYMRMLAFALAFIGFELLLHASNVEWFSARVAPTQFSVNVALRIVIVGLAFASLLFIAPQELREKFGVLVEALFANPFAMLLWFLLPLLFSVSYRWKTRRGWIE